MRCLEIDTIPLEPLDVMKLVHQLMTVFTGLTSVCSAFPWEKTLEALELCKGMAIASVLALFHNPCTAATAAAGTALHAALEAGCMNINNIANLKGT
jgi:hypothetical protein